MTTTRGGGDGEGSRDDPAGVAELSYSDAGAELDAIIEEFETGVVDVDRLVDQLQRATDIVDELDRRLRRTRIQVEELVPRLEAIGQVDVEAVEVFEVELDEDPSDSESDDPSSPGLF